MTPKAYPTPQTSRIKSNCAGCGPCFYCHDEIVGAHEHDHMPIPWRYGGRESVPACSRCHSLKDRKRRFDRWPPAAQVSAGEGMQGLAYWTLRFLTTELELEDGDPVIDRDTALLALSACTTAEARIALAHIIVLGYDVAAAKEKAAA